MEKPNKLEVGQIWRYKRAGLHLIVKIIDTDPYDNGGSSEDLARVEALTVIDATNDDSYKQGHRRIWGGFLAKGATSGCFTFEGICQNCQYHFKHHSYNSSKKYECPCSRRFNAELDNRTG